MTQNKREKKKKEKNPTPIATLFHKQKDKIHEAEFKNKFSLSHVCVLKFTILQNIFIKIDESYE